MSKIIKTIIFVFLCIAVISSDTPAENRQPRDLNQIIKSGKLIIAMVDMELPPFITGSGGEGLEGTEVDMARDIAVRLDVSLEIIRADYFDDVVDLVAAGKADIGLSNLSMSCDRARHVKFSIPYRTLQITLLLNRVKLASMRLPDGLIKPEQFKNTPGPIGVVEKSAYEAASRKYFPKAVFKTYKGYKEILRDVEKGNLFIAVGNSGTINDYLKKEPQLMVRLQPFNVEDFVDHIAIAVGLENDHLLSWLNTYLTVKGINR